MHVLWSSDPSRASPLRDLQSGTSGEGSLDRDPRFLEVKLKCDTPSELPIGLERMPDFAVYSRGISNTDKRIL